jgi:two-component system response regulator AtoC
LRSLRAETEIHAISRALEESGWNRKHAAKLLSISYRGLLYKIRQYNITPASRNNLAQAPRPEV